MTKRDLLTIFSLSEEEVLGIVKRGAEMKEMLRRRQALRPLEGRAVALIFEKASTRTRVSFEVGVSQLGGQPLVINAKDTQMGRGEPIKDTARVFARYVDCIVLRTFSQATLEALAEHASVPVVNALSDKYHPCQVLSDLLTVQEETGRQLQGLAYAWVGDGNNMCHSWIAAASVLGLELRVACPPSFSPDESVVARARAMGCRLRISEDPIEAVRGADVVSTDVWASMGQEGEAEARRAVFARYQVDGAMMARAKDGAIFLHCLPAHRGEEVTGEVIESSASRVWNQAENRLHVQKAILEWLIAGR